MTRVIGFLALALLGPPVALAQDATPPPQIGNTYDGTHHQPTAGAVGQAEDSSGVSTPGAQQQQTSVVESLDKLVQQNAQQSTGAAAGCTADRTNCAP